MAVAMAFGTAFVPTGRRFGAPRPWMATPVESPVSQILGVVFFAIVGACLIWQGYKAFRLGAKSERKDKH